MFRKTIFSSFLVVIFIYLTPSLSIAQDCDPEKKPQLNNQPNEIDFTLQYPPNPSDQVVGRGFCKTFNLKPRLKGDTGPVTIDIGGQGFHFEGAGNPTSVTISGETSVRICSTQESCGSGLLSIGGQEIGSVRSDVGIWVRIDEQENNCVISEETDGPVTSYPTIVNQYRVTGEKIQGKGKQTEVISRYYREPYLECHCDGFNGSSLGGYCTGEGDTSEGRCLQWNAMPYDGGFPCAVAGDGIHWSWCGCVAGLSYFEWECSE